MRRIPCIGDLHLKPGPRNADKRAGLQQIIREGLALPDLGAWFFAGDLNDAKPAIDDQNFLDDRLIEMAQRAPVLILEGNHDEPGTLDGFAKLATRYPVVVVTKPTVIDLLMPEDDVLTVACLPYPHRAMLAAQGIAPGEVLGEARIALEAIFREFAAQLQHALDRGRPVAFLAHVNVAGAITAAGQPNIGSEIELDPALLSLLPAQCPKIANHIHKPQEIGGLHYPGSVAAVDWGEAHEKRYLVLSLLEDGWSIEGHPLASAKMYHVEGELTRDGFTWNVVDGTIPASWSGHDVRVRYTYAQPERALLDESLVRETFADARIVEFEPIAVTDRGLRAPEVAAATTLPDKIAAWADLAGAALTEGAAEKLGQLSSASPEAVLSRVADRVAQLTEQASEVAA